MYKQEQAYGTNVFVNSAKGNSKTEILTPEEAFNEGWDYPARMGRFGIKLMFIAALKCEKPKFHKCLDKKWA